MTRVDRNPRLPLDAQSSGYRLQVQDLFSAHAGAISIAEEYSLIVPCSDETTALTTGTKRTFRMPWGMLWTRAPKMSLVTAQSSGSTFTVDVHVSGTTILTTKITTDNTESTSETATTPAVLDITRTRVLADEVVSIDIDQVGDGTAAGLKVTFYGIRG